MNKSIRVGAVVSLLMIVVLLVNYCLLYTSDAADE